VTDVPSLLRDLRSGAVPASISVAELARPLPAIAADLAVADVERMFRDESVTCLGVVSRGEPGRPGLLTRARFAAEMSGRLGYGRAVLTRRPVHEIADWEPLVLAPDVSVLEGALRAMGRPEERRFDDVVVRSDVWSSLETAALVRSLAGALAEQGTRDAVTGLVNRHSIVHTLTAWAASLAGSQRRLVVVLLDVNGFAAVNAAHGLSTGDAVLRELGRRVTAAVPQGCVVGRSGDDELLTVALLPATSDESAREYGEVLRRRLAAAVDAPAHSLPWPSVRTSTAVSRPGWADAELLLQEVHRTLALVGV